MLFIKFFKDDILLSSCCEYNESLERLLLSLYFIAWNKNLKNSPLHRLRLHSLPVRASGVL